MATAWQPHGNRHYLDLDCITSLFNVYMLQKKKSNKRKVSKVLFISTAECERGLLLSAAPTGGVLGGRHQARHGGQGSHLGQLHAGQRQRAAAQHRLLPVSGRLQHGRPRPAVPAHQRHHQGAA